MIRFAGMLVLLWSPGLGAQEPSAAALDEFERQIRPLLAKHCFECHGAKKAESGLRLDVRRSVFAEHDFGMAVIAGDPDNSRLLQVLRFDEDDIQMPPDGKLGDAEIAAVERWLKSGAAWPPEAPGQEPDPEAWRKHWAFQPIARPEPPKTNGNQSATAIDRFILRKLQVAGLQPAPRADGRTLARRLWFDLTGLPPSFEQVRELAADNSDANYERIVDRLLTSEHFGERWARHWMDVARYSDTSGYVFTEDRKLGDAWKYRDWLIRSFNNDMPINEFLTHQIAVDRVLKADAGDELSATGFLTLGRRFLNNVHDIIDDRIDVTTRGMMGLTVTCARCHDHKYDPIPTADYYSLYGVFASAREDRKKSTVRMADLPRPFDPYVFRRGQPHNRGPRVPRRFLSALDPDPQPFTDGSGRLDLARAIASPENPLTARVFVNRVWGHVFGRHLVTTPSDFGIRSQPPSHPELLDYLAGRLIDSGWSLKTLLREMLMSRTYQQVSRTPPPTDPENVLLSAMNRRRMDFEAHRDALLFASGDLDRTVGGPSADITKTPFPRRRTVYAHIDRQNLPGVFRAFDLASPDTHVPMRYQTTVPQQGLYQLNNPFVLERAVALAARTSRNTDPQQRIVELFRLAFAREPLPEETATSLAFIAQKSPAGVPSGWHYGYGRFDPKTGRVRTFTRYPVFAEDSWRGGPKLPDPKIGWSHLRSTGGHPGDADHAAIRRWVAPEAGTVFVRGALHHRSDQGNGVVGRLVSNRTGQLGEWRVANRATPTFMANVKVDAGETLDFVVESANDVAFDSFDWKVTLRLKAEGNERRFSSEKQFTGQRLDSLDAWARYAHVLLLANEFVFVD